MKNTIVIAGGSGELGSNLIPNILENYSHCIILDKKAPKILENNFRTTFIPHDFLHDSLIDLKKKIESCDVEIRGVVFAAGINPMDNIFSTTIRVMSDTYTVNTTSFVMLIKAFMPYFTDDASIVTISSQNGIASHPDRISYSASKAAINVLVKNITLDFYSGNISARVNAISPTYIINNLNKDILQGIQGKKLQKRMLYKSFVNNSEVTDTVLFLLSKNSRSIRGQNIVMDYGYSIINE